MAMAAEWHRGLVDEVGAFFGQDAEVRAVLVTGSVADPAVAQDAWSDVDIKVVLADGAVGRYFPVAGWLRRFGAVIGVERHDGVWTKTLRVCLDANRRLDLVLVPESTLAEPSFRLRGSLQEACAVVWSRLPYLDGLLDAPSELEAEPGGQGAPFVPVSEAQVAAMADPFWFQAAASIGKVMRRDLLIAAHLALDLARTCLVLQMMRRDRAFGTTVHRIGGWGNEAVGMVWPDAAGTGGTGPDTAREVLDLVERCGAAFDTLAADLAPSYEPRADLLRPAIDAAREALNARE